MIEEGNENPNQGNILLALRTEAEEERAKDDRGEVGGCVWGGVEKKKWRAVGRETGLGEKMEAGRGWKKKRSQFSEEQERRDKR